MQAVLGIDAAWTSSQPSGVALVGRIGAAWELFAVAPSYQLFCAKAEGEICRPSRPQGSQPEPERLLASAAKIVGHRVDLIAMDMPLALSTISGRRFCDNEVSRRFGAQKCATHSPSHHRPGKIADKFREEFALAGYELCVTRPCTTPGLIESYPHPALMRLAKAKERLLYKSSKMGRYWPDKSAAERKTLLFAIWANIVDLLNTKINGVAEALPPLPANARGWQLKAYEDQLDAIACAWIGICALEGRATAYGDEDSAIWIPDTTI